MPKTQPAEYERYEGQPLSPRRLAQLWKGLPEGERLGFVLSLDENLADKVIALCTPAQQSAIDQGSAASAVQPTGG